MKLEGQRNILIYEWNLSSLEELQKFILQKIKEDKICEQYTDIHVVGSRVLGYFKPQSDIDILILSPEKEIVRPLTYHWKGFKIHVFKRNKSLAFNKYHTSSYSLFSHELLKGRDDKEFIEFITKIKHRTKTRENDRNKDF